MSINGIRKIKDAKQQDDDLDKVRFQRLSKFTDSVYVSTYEGLSTGYGNKSETKKSAAIGFNSTSGRQTDRHRKTGSVVLSVDKQRSIADFVNRQLHLPISSYKFNQRQRPSNTGSLTSRKEREAPIFERPFTRLNLEGSRRPATEQETNKTNFLLDYVVGKGGFGKVWKVKQKKTGFTYAMKEMLKVKIIKKRSVHSVMNEKQLLQRLNYPFLVNIICSFQDIDNLYLVMDYVNGGDLRYHMGDRRRFSEGETKFVVACIILALQYLHNNGIIHRDLKPQNLVFDKEGFVRLTDLGVSRVSKPANAADTSGTPGYMAPEVICRRDHSFPVDHFALGIIAYEMMIGKRPYVGKNRAEIRDAILSKQARIEEPPKGWSLVAVDFINRLIQRKPQNRLGYSGMGQLKEHEWFRGFDWAGLSKRTTKPPFVPLTIEEDYQSYKRCISEDSEMEDEYQAKLLLRKPETQQMFKGYEYSSEKTRRRG